MLRGPRAWAGLFTDDHYQWRSPGTELHFPMIVNATNNYGGAQTEHP